jgi:hypothetical protein
VTYKGKAGQVPISHTYDNNFGSLAQFGQSD